MKSSTDEFAEGEQTPNPRREVDGREVEGREVDGREIEGVDPEPPGAPKEPHAPMSPIDWIELRRDVSKRHFRPMTSDSVARLRQADADYLHKANTYRLSSE